MNHTVEYLRILLFSGWRGAGAAVPLLMAVLAFMLPDALSTLEKSLIVVLVAMIAFTGKVIGQFFAHFQGLARPARFVRQTRGEGVHEGKTVLVMTNPGYIRDGTLLTLFAGSSGADQAICILRVVLSQPGADLHLLQHIPPEEDYTISPWLQDEARRRGLFAVPLVNEHELSLLAQLPTRG